MIKKVSTQLDIYFLFEENDSWSFEEILEKLKQYSTDEIFNAINILIGNNSLKLAKNGSFSRVLKDETIRGKFVQDKFSQSMDFYKDNLSEIDLTILSTIFTGAPIESNLVEKLSNIETPKFQSSLKKLSGYNLIKEKNGQLYCCVNKDFMQDIIKPSKIVSDNDFDDDFFQSLFKKFDSRKNDTDDDENNESNDKTYIQKIVNLISDYRTGNKKINYGPFKADIILFYVNGKNKSEKSIRVDSNATFAEIVRYYLVAEWGSEETCIFFQKPYLNAYKLVNSERSPYLLSGCALCLDDDNGKTLRFMWNDVIFGSDEQLDYLLLRNKKPVIQLDIKDIGEWIK